jgi:transcriptional regulator
MYVPRQFKNNEPAQIKDFIRSNGFAILVSQCEGKIVATHHPLELSEDGEKLSGHISRANPQWKNFNQDTEVLAIFNGPHAYISSSWYNHENVPTWNYIAVQVYGKISIIEGEQLIQSLKTLVDKYEKNSVNPVSVEKMSPEYFQHAIKGVVGFEISISKIEASYKLSQNRDQVNHDAIVKQLEKRNDGDDRKVAEAMKKSFDINPISTT